MMSSDAVWYWLLAGAALMLAELVIPGGIVVFLGAACVVVAGALWAGIVHGWVQSLTLWFISSIVLLLSFRQVTQRMLGGDSHVDNTDEELDIYNQRAQVKEAIGPGEKTGRITFQGADWPALGDGSVIPAGTAVRIICRENIALVVEPLQDGE
ncbi:MULTISPECIES: NfeD family protein [Shewanella]|uniref:Membrane protein implicated in regulation of membrane protease activity n=1 Tax=Shewanella fodinae TaxID=552357 RepID=A0A4R2F713_9GAMM|nr:MULTISPECIES: NfeD family protein [Shewanella]MBO1271015.1 NfeD family protein [Shewanella sp. 4t3-1-2LB]TCN80728.1 membrane protein implicated in regulation of membrane protease activity [Shewanella fodinae]